MNVYTVYSAAVRATVTGELRNDLVGQQVQVVTRGTTTPFPIQTEAGDPISGSLLTVQSSFCVNTFYLDVTDPSDLYLDWLDPVSGERGGLDFDAVLRDAAMNAAADAAASAASALASENSAAAVAGDIAAFQEWFEAGQTVRNLVLDPRATNAARWASGPGTGGVINEAMVTGATDGPLLPDGSRATSYVRYTVATANTGGTPYVNYVPPAPAANAFPAGTPVVMGIYVRPSVATSWGPRLYGVDPANVVVWTGTSGAAVAIAANTWVRVGYAQVVATACGDFIVRAVTAAILPVGMTIDVTLALSTPGMTAVPDHYDGDVRSTTLVGNRWSGTPNASVSEHVDMSKVVRTVNGVAPDSSGNVTVAAGGGGVSAHSALSGLGGDDHSQYLNQQRGDARYYTKAQVDAAIASAVAASSAQDRMRANHTGSQAMSSIDLLSSALAVRDISIDVVTGLEERPSGSNRVRWVGGSTQPANMIGGDVWESRTGSTPGDTTPPTAPASVSTSGVAATSLTLSWTAASDNIAVTGYRVRRNGALLPTLYTGTSALMTGLSASTAYVFEVAAQDANENLSTFTAAPSVTTGASSDTEDPSVPDNLVASSITAAGFTVTCDEATDNVGVTGYRWLLDGVEYDISDGPSQVFTGRTAGTEYDVTVQAMDLAGNVSDLSEILPVTTSAGGSLPTHSVFSTPPGALAKTTEASPYEHATGFYTYSAGANGWKVKGARLYVPNGISVPTTCEVNLYAPGSGAPTLGSPTKTVTMTGITANAWNTVNFPSVEAVDPGEVFWIGIKFADGTWLGVTTFGESFVAAADASTLVLSDRVPNAGLDRNYRRIGTGSTVALTGGGERDVWFGMDVIVEED